MIVCEKELIDKFKKVETNKVVAAKFKFKADRVKLCCEFILIN